LRLADTASPDQRDDLTLLQAGPDDIPDREIDIMQDTFIVIGKVDIPGL
jgi:hypothetical protein